ncbi:MAG: P1 family peptidase, partial [Myxococcales bacterium]
LDQRMDPLYEAVIEATEEAILNSMCMARDLDGVNGNFSPALPIGEVKAWLSRYKELLPKPQTGRRAQPLDGEARPLVHKPASAQEAPPQTQPGTPDDRKKQS